MLFGRGVWSIFGIRKTSGDKFIAGLSDRVKLYKLSQFKASILTRQDSIASFGINPFADPRKDETKPFAPETFPMLLSEDLSVVALEELSANYGAGFEEYSLGDGQYGFWVVINDFEDVTDPKSKQEAFAYKETGKPFKFLSKEEKKLIESNIKASAVCSRTQFPVLVDFNSETVYAASGNAEQVGLVRTLIASLGGEDFSLAWQFDGYDWPSRFLKTINDEMRDTYRSAMATRAEELSRFRPEEVEKLDDRMMEGVVSSYFAMTELETGKWAGLTTPARVRLFKASDPATASNPSVAFSLMQEFTDGQIAAAGVVFQSLDSKFNKKTEDEVQYRSDLFTIDVNDNVNLTDAGAAMLRGFDLPRFKKEMKKFLKEKGTISILDFWKEWLSATKTACNMFVDNVTETLKIDKQKYGLKPYESESAETAGSN